MVALQLTLLRLFRLFTHSHDTRVSEHVCSASARQPASIARSCAVFELVRHLGFGPRRSKRGSSARSHAPLSLLTLICRLSVLFHTTSLLFTHIPHPLAHIHPTTHSRKPPTFQCRHPPVSSTLQATFLQSPSAREAPKDRSPNTFVSHKSLLPTHPPIFLEVLLPPAHEALRLSTHLGR